MIDISKKTVAVILGGGAGSRLSPLTATRSKPAVPIAGKYRLVDIPISNCMNSDVFRMFVLTQFNSASLNKHIKNTYQFSSFSKARQILHHLEAHDFEYILILSGDQLYQMDFRLMMENHIAKGADISIATIPVGDRDAPEFGILKADDDGNITSFIEKPKKDVLKDWTSDTGERMQRDGRNYLASMGIYIFNKDLLFNLLRNELKDATDFGKEIIPYNVGKKVVTSYQYEGYWTDIGNIYSFYEANLALTLDIPPFNLFDNEKAIYTRSRMLPPTKISGTTFEKAVIAEGCIILASRIEHSVVGIRSRIGTATTIAQTYIMGSDYYESMEEMQAANNNNTPLVGIGHRCYITNAIIDKNCRIGNDVRIVGGNHLANTDHPLYAVKDGIVVVKKGAILPNGFTIGS
jgi:glucose-1-phosphate adenylyltransferase